ncbi:MAG: isopentenyl-diphosphate Delta-isomerase [Flavobacterium sp.]|nr:isopentenyl-diphosphate Delta-isomerase [Pedobacter sp.]
MNDLLILVDENDNEVGEMDKLEVHLTSTLHRAFSIFIFNSKRELLLQQRAESKYHSGGLWSNTCCSHPCKGEKTFDTINRRLKEEMGIKCKIGFKFSFIYKTLFDNGLSEHELDHVYFGLSNDIPKPNPLEVQNYKYITLADLENDLIINPTNYTSWLTICLPDVIKHFNT